MPFAISRIEVDHMQARSKNGWFQLLLMALGSIMIVGTAVTASSLAIAMANGIRFHTVNDVRATVARFVFELIVPLFSGALMIAAGISMLDRDSEAAKRSVRLMAAQKSERHRTKLLDALLEPDEKSMLDTISGSNGLLQSDLTALTGYSKVKVHRLLKKLEAKQLIKRSRAGITNKIFVNDISNKNH